MAEIESCLEIVDSVLGEILKIASNPIVISDFPEIAQRVDLMRNVGVLVGVSFDTLIAANGASCEKLKSLQSFNPKNRSAGEKSIALCPIFSDGFSEAKHCFNFDPEHTFAGYGAENNFIVFNAQKIETLSAMAFYILHELGHAKAAYERGDVFSRKSRNRSTKDRVAEEMELWTLDYKLLLALGGYKYCLLAFEFACLAYKYHAGLSDNFPINGCGHALKEFWGSSPSVRADDGRDASFATYSSLYAADIFFSPEESRAIKLDFMEKAYNRTYESDSEFEKQLSVNKGWRALIRRILSYIRG